MSALSAPFYINLKTTFMAAMKNAVVSNKNVTIAQFPDKDKMNSHYDIIKGWELSIDKVEVICKEIEDGPQISMDDISSALNDPYYIELKSRFLKTMDDEIKSNNNVPFGSFKEKTSLISHFDIIVGMGQSVDNFKIVCKGIEEAPAQETPAPQNDSPTITEGEIVE